MSDQYFHLVLKATWPPDYVLHKCLLKSLNRKGKRYPQFSTIISDRDYFVFSVLSDVCTYLSMFLNNKKSTLNLINVNYIIQKWWFFFASYIKIFKNGKKNTIELQKLAWPFVCGKQKANFCILVNISKFNWSEKYTENDNYIIN